MVSVAFRVGYAPRVDPLLLVLWPAVLAGLVAIGVTVAIERLGGVVGGLLGTMPTTIVPAVLGIWVASEAPSTFHQAMGSVPLGMLAATLFLYSWRWIPPRLPAASLAVQLAWMLGISLCWWALLASGAVSLVAWGGRMGVAPWILGAVALGVNVLFGALASARRVPAPTGNQPVSWPMLLARGVLAGAANAVSTWLARAGDGYLSTLR